MITDKDYEPITYLEVSKSYAIADFDAQLDLFHNTRHANQKQASIKKGLRQLRSPWLSRFDWIFDVGLQARFNQQPRYVLTKQRESPRTVFVNLHLMRQFVAELLAQLELPVVLYIGNVDLPVSHCQVDLLTLADHPMIAKIFCEQKNIPDPRLQAMPIGIDPYDLVKANNGYHLQGLMSRVQMSKKKRTVLAAWSTKRTLHLTRNDREEIAHWIDTQDTLFQRYDTLTYSDYRKKMAQHRFVLAPWGDSYDTSRIFEALILKSIPIIFSGPYAEAFEGLPVVVIDRLSDINESSLEQWWESLSNKFENPEFLYADYWWRKIKRACPARKRAYLVVGPESSGNHFVTDLLCQAGCYGHSGDHADWQQGSEAETLAYDDVQPWDLSMPQDQSPIVWRRSVPHLKNLPNIAEMVASLEARDYTVSVVVVSRDKYATLQSQLKWGHISDASQGLQQIALAYQHIFAHIRCANVAYTLVNYESLVNYSHARDFLLNELGLAQEQDVLGLFDGNEKWAADYNKDKAQTLLETERAARPSTDQLWGLDFPEHWFVCENLESEQRYQQQLHIGYQNMALQRVVICAIARDAAEVLPIFIHRINILTAKFLDYRVVIYENDSSDHTLTVLNAWQQSNSRVVIISQTLGRKKWGQVDDCARTQDLADCRNHYVDYVQQHFADFDVVAVVDVDNPRGFSIDGIASSFAIDNWHVVGSNGVLVPEYDVPGDRPVFFDSFALRYPGDALKQRPANANQKVYHRGEAALPMWSCFGGLALYAMPAFVSGVRYQGDSCEHVCFHYSLRAQGFDRLFLNPSQFVMYTG